MTEWILAVLMIAGFALLGGGVYLLSKGNNRKQGILMIIASAIMFANVAIWLVPIPEGSDPVASYN